MEKAPFTDLYGFVHPVPHRHLYCRDQWSDRPKRIGVYINTDGQLGMLTVQELKSIVAKQQATIAQQRKDFEANTRSCKRKFKPSRQA